MIRYHFTATHIPGYYSDTNWWKGSNHRGEGLFPANFVTSDLSESVEPAAPVSRTVQFNEEVRIKVIEEEPKVVTIDPEKIDRLIGLLHEADPTGEEPDSDELISLEGEFLDAERVLLRHRLTCFFLFSLFV